MPCLKENYIVLEQSVTVDSADVDSLVTQIGEALQLHGGGGAHQSSVSVSVSCLRGLTGGADRGGAVKPAAGGASTTAAPALRNRGCCVRLRSRGGPRGGSRASPYHVPGPHGDQDWDQVRPWSRRRLSPEEEDDPHRLLQELLLSGNLIKEAVRRLQFSPDCGDFPRAADNVSCS
ncbi:glycogen synthase kinase binding protein [Xenentodon cancila]